MIRLSSSAATSSDRFPLIADLAPWAVMWMRYTAIINNRYMRIREGRGHVAGLGCVGVLGTPALRRDNGERE
jgi:hypothetical protein